MAIFIPSIYLDNERLLKSGTHSLQFVCVKHATVLLSIGHVWTDAGKQFQLIEIVLVDRKLATYDAHLHEGPEGGCRELQAC